MNELYSPRFPSPFISTTEVGKRPLRTPKKRQQWKQRLINFNYQCVRKFCRLVFYCTVRVQIDNPEILKHAGGFILVSNHESHLDPHCLSTIITRKIDWMARMEFYRYNFIRKLLDSVDAFPVKRQGVPVRAMKTAIERAREGRVIGVFPEGKIACGADSLLNGAKIKNGAAMIARRADVPVIPCLVSGSPGLEGFKVWLPFRRGSLKIRVGNPVHVVSKGSRKETDRCTSEKITAAICALHTTA